MIDKEGARVADAVRVAWWRWYEMVVCNTASVKCMA